MKTGLIIEDEEHIVFILKELLIDYQVSVLTAASGEEALQILAAHTVNFCIADISLPDFSGMDLYRKAVKKYPDLEDRFIFMSGFSPDNEIMDFIDNSKNRFIQKPFSLQVFKDQISDLLNEL